MFWTYIAVVCAFKPAEHWGNTSPYQSTNWGIKEAGLPQGCRYDQIHVLHRHTDRYPRNVPDGSGAITNFSKKLRTSPDFNATGPLEFLHEWVNVLDKEILTAKGRASAFESGSKFWAEYGRLLFDTPNASRFNKSLLADLGYSRKPVFRATDQSRVLETARWWLTGFFGQANGNGSDSLYDLIITPEEVTEAINNTLATTQSCKKTQIDSDASLVLLYDFVEKYTTVLLPRFQAAITGIELTWWDIWAMQHLCIFEIAALQSSSFCVLFEKEDWLNLEYARSIQFYRAFSFGARTGRARGIGYLLELRARLQGQLITSSSSSINATLDSDEATFGYFDQKLFFDASHDADMVGVLTALGLKQFQEPGLLTPEAHAPERFKFQISKMTPFGARMQFEVIICSGAIAFSSYSTEYKQVT